MPEKLQDIFLKYVPRMENGHCFWNQTSIIESTVIKWIDDCKSENISFGGRHNGIVTIKTQE